MHYITDLFSVKPSLRFLKEKESSTSNWGRLFSLILAILMTALGAYLFSQIWTRSNNKSAISDFIIEDPEKVDITPDLFAFSISLEDPVTYAMYIDDSIYQIKFTQFYKTRTIVNGLEVDKFQSKIIELETCTKEHFGPAAAKFVNASLNSTYCIAKNQPDGLVPQLRGVWESTYHSYFQISFRTCVNGTKPGVICKDPDTIQKKIRGGYFNINFVDFVIDPSNYEEPAFKFRNAFYTNTDDRYSRTVNMDMESYTVATDTGFIGETYSYLNFLKLGNIQEFLFPNGRGNLLLNINMQLDRHYTICDRVYLKLLDVISQLNGAFATLLVLFAYLMGPYSNYKYYENILNRMYHNRLEAHNKGTKVHDKTNASNGSGYAIDVNNKNDLHATWNSFKRSNLKNKEEDPNDDFEFQNELNLSFFEYYMSFVWKSEKVREKYRRLKEGAEIIDQKLNIFTLLESIEDVEFFRLKALEEQNNQNQQLNQIANSERSIPTEPVIFERKN